MNGTENGTASETIWYGRFAELGTANSQGAAALAPGCGGGGGYSIYKKGRDARREF